MVVLLFLPTVLIEVTPLRAAGPGQFDVAVATDVFATALAFMAPRTLDPIPVSQLTLWGLNGLTALDSRLTAAAQGSRLVLRAPEGVVASVRMPPEGDAESWGSAAATIAEAGWAASVAVRQAGSQGVITSFFDELFNHLDPYSRYTPPDDARGDLAKRDGSAGIGVELAGPPGQVRVTSVKPDGPAGLAGLHPGARLLTVDGQSTRGQDAQTIADWLGGPEDSRVELTISTGDGAGRVRRMTLTRAVVTPETVFAERHGNQLLLRVTSFSRDTDARVEAEIDAALRTPPRLRGMILDLRGNRGGLLRQAVLVADALQGGGVVAVTAGRDPEASVIWRAGPDDMTKGLPIVVLVDGRTASAAEILAASLQDQGRAVVVGSATLGKGLVQTVAPMPDGGELFITWSRVLTPAGYPLQGLGVLPQICTSLGQSQLDRQMAALNRGDLITWPALQRHDQARAPVPVPQMLDIRATCPAAEGRDADLQVARKLLSDPATYAAARLSLALPAP